MGSSCKLLGHLLFLFVLLMVADCGKSKKTIKIHVPYYVKHIHHYKKVYVPKVQVIKHEHHHKKEHDHHHHHHDHGHDHGHDHYHSYDKSGHGYGDESSHYDTYYDEIDSRTYGGEKSYPARRGKLGYRENPQYRGWKDVDGSEYRSDDSTEEEEEDYSAEAHDYPATKTQSRSKPSNLVIPIYRKRVRSNRRWDDDVLNDTVLAAPVLAR